MSESIIRSRIDPKLKEEANQLFNSMGLTMSDAVRLFIRRALAEKRIPFPIEAPNTETIAAMQSARKKKVEKVSLDQLEEEWKDK